MRILRCVAMIAMPLVGALLAGEARSEPPFRPTAKYWRTGHLSRSARRNPAQTWWMARYTERDAIHYRRVYDYRSLLDYPWSIPMPPPPPVYRTHEYQAESGVLPDETLPAETLLESTPPSEIVPTAPEGG